LADLAQRLQTLGRDLDYPRGANLAAEVRRRIELPAPRRSWWPRAVLAAAAVALVLLAAAAAFPPSRDAIAHFFGIKGVIINRVPLVPTPTLPAGPIGERLRLGRQVTLAEAQTAVGYHVLVPSGLGLPDQVFVMDPGSRKAVALVYLPRQDLPQADRTGVGLLLIEFPGKVDTAFLFKMVGQDATVKEVRVNGQPGAWISGKPHAIGYLAPNGQDFLEDTVRLSGDTLVWNQGTLTLRIESGLTEAQAIALAATLR
jgi:hypothetical protein